MDAEKLRTFFRKLPLKNRIILATLAILFFWGLFCFVSFRWFVSDLLSQQVAEHYRTVGGFVAESAIPLISKGDTEGLVRLVREFQTTDEHLDSVSVLDAEGRFLSGWSNGGPMGDSDARLRVEVRGKRPPGMMSSNGGKQPPAYSVQAPIMDGERRLGSILLDVSDAAFRRHAQKVRPIFFLSLGCLIVLSYLVSVKFTDNVTQPVVRLTQLADEISQGNLDVNIDFGEHVNCWEIKHCRETGCAAYENREAQCWFVDGTPCEGYEPRFPQKLGQCRNCEVYQAHRGDEIVQLADSFKHMAYKLKVSQKELTRAYNLQKCLIQSSFDGIVASDANGVILIFNCVAEQLTGFSEEEVVGKKTWRNFLDADLIKEIRRPMPGSGGTVLHGFAPRESVIFHRDGRFTPVLIGGVSLTHETREAGYVVFFYDLRELKRLRRDLIQSERMAAVGQTVASISHSIKNILDGLRGGVFIINRARESNDKAKTKLGWEMIEKNIEIISELVIDLLNYSKERRLDFQRTNPNKLLRDVCAVMRRKAGSKGAHLICEGDDSINEAFLDPFSMHQCLVNLISNALDAVDQDRGGRVVVKILREGEDRLCFKVKDNGMGMSPEVQSRILKGMFSTKGSKGTGLGLLVVQKVVKEHQGTIEVESEQGVGSEFTISMRRLGHDLQGLGSGSESHSGNPCS